MIDTLKMFSRQISRYYLPTPSSVLPAPKIKMNSLKQNLNKNLCRIGIRDSHLRAELSTLG